MSNYIILIIITLILTQIEAKRHEEIRPGRHDDVDRFDEVYMIVRNTFLLVLAPVVISFLYNVLKDPDLPFILITIWRKMKEKVLGSLSSSISKSEKSD